MIQSCDVRGTRTCNRVHFSVTGCKCQQKPSRRRKPIHRITSYSAMSCPRLILAMCMNAHKANSASGSNIAESVHNLRTSCLSYLVMYASSLQTATASGSQSARSAQIQPPKKTSSDGKRQAAGYLNFRDRHLFPPIDTNVPKSARSVKPTTIRPNV